MVVSTTLTNRCKGLRMLSDIQQKLIKSRAELLEVEQETLNPSSSMDL